MVTTLKMFSLLLLASSLVIATLLVITTSAYPLKQQTFALGHEIQDPCSSKVARTDANVGAAASIACFQELQAHVFVGGKNGVIGSGSGGHLASRVLSLRPDKVGDINAASLVMNATVADITKTLWLDDGLQPLMLAAEKAAKELEAAKERVKMAEFALGKAPNATRRKSAANALKKARAAVQPLSPLHKVILRDIKPHIHDPSVLYTAADITAICVDAMKMSITNHHNLLKGGMFRVTAPNLGGCVPVRLLEDKAKGRINSCFPVM